MIKWSVFISIEKEMNQQQNRLIPQWICLYIIQIDLLMHTQLLILFIVLSCHSSKVIESKPQKHFNLEVGAAFNEKIPLLFSNYQHSELQNFTNDQYQLSMHFCNVQLDLDGDLGAINSIPYDTFGPTEKQIEDRIIYDITELKNLKIFVDAIYFQSKFIALFQNNQVDIYSINLSTGLLSLQLTMNLTEASSLNDAEFVIFNKYCYIISHEQIINIDTNGNYLLVANYKYQQFTIGEAVEIGSLFCVAQEEEGLFIYIFDPSTASLQLVRNATFEVNDGNIQADFSVDEFYFDRHGGEIFILDHEEGLLKTKFQELYNSIHVAVDNSKILIGGCQNLVVAAHYIYMTCPELIQINRKTFKIENVIHNSFSPYAINHTEQRLYLFGRQEFAVFDIFGKLVEEHALVKNVHAQKSIVVGDYIITFTNTKVISNSIISHTDQLYCSTSDIALKGSYHGFYKSYGLCNEYKEFPINSTEICFVEYPFTLTITDSAPSDNTLEVILIVVWGVILFLAALYCSIKNYLIHRGYTQMKDTLVEQDAIQQKQKKQDDNTMSKINKNLQRNKEMPKEEIVMEQVYE